MSPLVKASVVNIVLVLAALSVQGSSEFRRHRHSRSHPQNHDLDRLMNYVDSKAVRSTPPPTYKPPDTGNSVWGRNDSTQQPLDGDRWNRILQRRGDHDQEERLREAMEDAEDELEEMSGEEEEGFEDQNEQADSYRNWNSRSGESHSNWKWDNMGTRKSVDNLFQAYRSGVLKPEGTGLTKTEQAQLEVYKHNKQMSRETQCRLPRPKVVRVADVYPSTSRLYVPACTVLHQCGDDTGCCGGAQRCGPKTTKRIELHFYTTYLMSSHSRQRTSSGLEKLPFYNHTECECQDRLEDVMPRDTQAHDYSVTEKNPEASCKCPSEYTVRRLANGSCSCDCFDKQRDCIKYKKGKEYFNHNDRLCIVMGTCQLPSCDFGVYLRSSGRCPRKHEKFRTWSRYH